MGNAAEMRELNFIFTSEIKNPSQTNLSSANRRKNEIRPSLKNCENCSKAIRAESSELNISAGDEGE